MQNKRSLGAEKEEMAAYYIKEQGAELLAKNFYFHGGELDLIVKDGDYLCFVEVKYRKSIRYGFPEEAVTLSKQKKIVRGAKVYLYQNRYPEDTPCRFDVISICGGNISWMKNAFIL